MPSGFGVTLIGASVVGLETVVGAAAGEAAITAAGEATAGAGVVG